MVVGVGLFSRSGLGGWFRCVMRWLGGWTTVVCGFCVWLVLWYVLISLTFCFCGFGIIYGLQRLNVGFGVWRLGDGFGLLAGWICYGCWLGSLALGGGLVVYVFVGLLIVWLCGCFLVCLCGYLFAGVVRLRCCGLSGCCEFPLDYELVRGGFIML